jgi:hypothetical protein
VCRSVSQELQISVVNRVTLVSERCPKLSLLVMTPRCICHTSRDTQRVYATYEVSHTEGANGCTQDIWITAGQWREDTRIRGWVEVDDLPGGEAALCVLPRTSLDDLPVRHIYPWIATVNQGKQPVSKG